MIFDTNSIAVSPSSHNGRMLPATGNKWAERSPEEELAWSIMEQAIDDLVTLCRWGLITPSGRCMPWPRRKRLHWSGAMVDGGYVKVANMLGPLDHAALKEFFLEPTQAQLWADLIGMNLPMVDVWQMTLKNNCGRQP